MIEVCNVDLMELPNWPLHGIQLKILSSHEHEHVLYCVNHSAKLAQSTSHKIWMAWMPSVAYIYVNATVHQQINGQQTLAITLPYSRSLARS